MQVDDEIDLHPQPLFQIGVALKHLCSANASSLHQPKYEVVTQNKQGLFEQGAQRLHRYECAYSFGRLERRKPE